MSEMESLLPVYHRKENGTFKMSKGNGPLTFQISFSKFGWITISCPLFGFVFCVLWSIWFNFEEAVATHCSVPNYLPSISAATGHYYPQIYVWILVILFQFLPRLTISSMYFHYFSSVILDDYANWYYLAWFSHVCELWALLGLSLINSTLNYTIHAFSFVTFLLSSIFYMIFTCYLMKFKRKIPAGNLESRVLKWKFNCCLLNIFCFLTAGYFFWRHNSYCEPGVYSIFSLFEYGVVLTNMLFHLFAIWEFHDKTMVISLTLLGPKFQYSPPFKISSYSLK